MFHFPGFASTHLWIQCGMTGVYPVRFPDSEISALTPVNGYTELIAVCHVLHRLLVPRHPWNALSSLTILNSLSSFRLEAAV